MPELTCPSCDADQEVPESFLPEEGTEINCPDCGATFKALPNGLTALADDTPPEEEELEDEEVGTDDAPFISSKEEPKQTYGSEPADGRLIHELPSEIGEPVTLASGRYTLSEDVHVHKEGSLTVQPDTRITSEQSYFVVKGLIRILGEPDADVRFLGGGLIFEGPHVDESLVRYGVFTGGVGGRGDKDRGVPEHAGGVTLMNTLPASVELVNCRFEENSSDEQGGAVLATNGQARLEDCTFAENESKGGGALKCEGESQVEVVACVFKGNHSPSGTYVGGSGGAIASWRSSLEVEESTFRENTADDKGGAIFVSDDSEFIERDNVFTENKPDAIFRG